MQALKDSLLHLHGSYKFWKHANSDTELKIHTPAMGTFVKCLKYDSWFPVVVFGEPYQKLQIIGKYKILQSYYDALKYVVSTWPPNEKTKQGPARVKLVIWGTKFDSAPHLRKLLKGATNDSKIKEIVILLRNEESAKSLFEDLTSDASSKPSFRYVSFSSSQTLLDVVKEI